MKHFFGRKSRRIGAPEPEERTWPEVHPGLIEWLETVPIPETFALGPGLQVVDAELFRAALLDDLGLHVRTGQYQAARGRLYRLTWIVDDDRLL